MKKEFKIVICGGGSTYTAGIVKNLLEEEELKIKELWLYDIDQERQEKVSLIVKEVVKDLRPSLELKISTDEEEAFTDADFIMAQMRVGGLKMRVKDEQISLKHGCIGQETCGAGGMAYGMRTIGPMVHLIDVCEKYASKDDPVLKKADEIKHYLLHEKVEGEKEKPDVLFMKGTIRREEARTACRYTGVKDENVHFLDLPFYETGLVKKNDLGEADKDIVKALIEKIQPDQMFVAGDLADPHGTHKVCLDAILAAIDDVKDEEWMKNCRVWMYRGAWAEWEMDHVEMAVPISPEELRFKRNSILKHQSQMESAPFLGNDERLFWQRSEDRNRGTAALYDQLGLACYEAMEAFVEYVPL